MCINILSLLCVQCWCVAYLLITALYLVRQMILYSHSVWVTNILYSLFRYFSIILFAAYTVNRQILVRFFPENF